MYDVDFLGIRAHRVRASAFCGRSYNIIWCCASVLLMTRQGHVFQSCMNGGAHVESPFTSGICRTSPHAVSTTAVFASELVSRVFAPDLRGGAKSPAATCEILCQQDHRWFDESPVLCAGVDL